MHRLQWIFGSPDRASIEMIRKAKPEHFTV